MFGDFFSFGATTTDGSFEFSLDLSGTADPSVDIGYGEVDVTFSSIFDVIETNAAPVAEDDAVTTES